MRRSGLLLFLLVSCSVPAPTGSLRIVSLAPGLTELVYALKLESHLVGVTTQCDFPAAARRKPKVGDYGNPQVERIVALKPSVVLAMVPEQVQGVSDLRRLGVNVVTSEPATIDALVEDIRRLGAALGAGPRADSLAASISGALVCLPRPRHRPRVFVEISSQPLVTAGGRSFLSDVVAAAGGENIFADFDAPFPMVSSEEVIHRNPEVILLLHTTANPEEVKRRLGWSGIDAVRSSKVCAGLNQDLLLRPGPRITEGARLLSTFLSQQ